jgi:hypothetical protein
MDTLYKRIIGTVAITGALMTSGCRTADLPTPADEVQKTYNRITSEDPDKVPTFAEGIDGKVLEHTWRKRDTNEWQSKNVPENYRAVEEIVVEKADGKLVKALRPRKSTSNRYELPKGTPVHIHCFLFDLYSVEKR